MPSRHIAWLTAAAALLASCGGGGGGGSGPAAAPAVITVGNAPVIAGEVVRVALATSDFADSTDGTSTVSASSTPAAMALTRAGNATVQQAARTVAGPGTAALAIGPETVPCDVSGSVTLSGNLQNETILTAGDQITADFFACDDGDGTVLDGLLDLTVLSAAGDFLGMGSFSGSFSLTFTELRLTEGTEVNTANGDVTLETEFDTATDIDTSTLSGSELELTSGPDTWRLNDFAVTTTVGPFQILPDPPIDVTRIAATGTLLGSGFEGTVDFTTVRPFEHLENSDHPGAGELLITGANDATIRIIDAAGANVTLEVDLNGDAVPDTILDSTWNALLDD